MSHIRRFIVILVFLTIIFYTSLTSAITIVLDPGHGGYDTGAIADNGLCEREVTLKISRYLKEYLEPYDVNVLLTHNGNIPSNDELKLLDRALFARKNKADLFASIHINNSSSKKVEGAEVFVSANTSLDKYNKDTTILGNRILNNLLKLGINSRGVKTRLLNGTDETDVYSDGSVADYYGVIRFAMRGTKIDYGVVLPEGAVSANLQKGEGVPSILIEHCFITGPDFKYVSTDENIKKLAKADADAFIEHYKLRKKSEVVSEVKLNLEKVQMFVNEVKQLQANVLPNTATNKNLNWKSSNEKVATVDKNGKITAVSIGTATITVTTVDNNKTAKCEVTVGKNEIVTNYNEINLLVDKSKEIKAEIFPYNLSELKMKYEVKDKNIATVDNKGIIKGIEKGETVLIIKEEKTGLNKDIKIKVIELDKNSYIKINNIKNENGTLTKIGEQIKTRDFLKNIQISDDLNIELENVKDDIVTTGTNVYIKHKETKDVIEKYNCLIYGDVNNDGKITPSDYVNIKNHIMKTSTLKDLQYTAADIDRNGNITPSDYVNVKNHIMKVKLIDM